MICIWDIVNSWVILSGWLKRLEGLGWGMALWLYGFWRWPSALLLASDFSDVLGEHQDGENTTCEGDKESS